jgi:hypothetical protein
MHRTPSASLDSSNSPATSRQGRRLIAQDTLKRTKVVIKEYAAEGATNNSTFYSKQLYRLEPPNKDAARKPVIVVNSDAYTTARKIFEEHTDAKGSVAVLNLASDEHPAGGWLQSLSRTQVGIS